MTVDTYTEKEANFLALVKLVSGHNIHTSLELTKDVITKIKIKKKSTFAVLFNIEFVFTLIHVYGVDASNITFFGDCDVKKLLINKYGCKYEDVSVLLNEEFVKMNKKKFTHTVGNPPYYHGMWRKIIMKSIEITEQTVSIISPDDRYDFGPTAKNNLEYYEANGIQTIEDVTHHFPKEINAGVPLCKYHFDLQKESNPSAININGEAGKHRELLRKYSVERNNNDRKFARGQLKVNHIERSESQDASMSRCVLYSIAKGTGASYTYTNSTDRTLPGNYGTNWNGRLFATNQYFGTEKDAHVEEINGKDVAVGNNVMVYDANATDTTEGFKSVYTSELYLFLLAIRRNATGWNRDTSFNNLPYMDLSRTWTDAEIYTHYNVEVEDQQIIQHYLTSNKII